MSIELTPEERKQMDERTRSWDIWATRLPRTPYLVIPRLAISAMPLEWQERLEQLLVEADDAGMETPSYYVFRGGDDEYTRAKLVNYETGFVKIVHGREDPWANYKYGDAAEIMAEAKAAEERRRAIEKARWERRAVVTEP